MEQLEVGFILSGHPQAKFNGEYKWIYTQDDWPVLAKGFVVDAEMATQWVLPAKSAGQTRRDS